MKRLLIGLSLAMSGCGLLGKEFTVKKTAEVSASATDALCDTSQLTFNLADDEAFSDLKNNLGKVEVRKVVVRVNNPKTDAASIATKANGTLKVSAGTGEAVQLATYTDVPLTAGASQELVYSAEAAAKLAEAALAPPNSFLVEASGCVDKVPAGFTFDVELTLYAELKP